VAHAGRVTATLVVRGEGLEPDEITRILGASPDRLHRIGDLVSSRGTGRHKQGMWSITSIDGGIPESAPLADHIAALMQRTASDHAVWRALAERFQIHIAVGWFMATWNEGVSLPPQLLEELGRRSLPVDFDVYESDRKDTTPSA
jgi:Domain of unknown function (DUF4279)